MEQMPRALLKEDKEPILPNIMNYIAAIRAMKQSYFSAHIISVGTVAVQQLSLKLLTLCWVHMSHRNICRFIVWNILSTYLLMDGHLGSFELDSKQVLLSEALSGSVIWEVSDTITPDEVGKILSSISLTTCLLYPYSSWLKVPERWQVVESIW